MQAAVVAGLVAEGSTADVAACVRCEEAEDLGLCLGERGQQLQVGV